MATEHRADVCVVGAGPAGAIVAERLAARGRRVLVLEHGPRLDGLAARRRVITPLHVGAVEDQIDPAYEQDYVTPATEEYTYHRVSAVGGSSLHWVGYCPRPIEDDLRPRTRFGYDRDWPLAWAELEPWLGRAERALGVAGSDDDNPYASTRSSPYPMPRHPATELEERVVRPAAARLGWRVHAQPVAIASRPYQGRPACRHCATCGVCPSGARYSADLVHVPRLLHRGGALREGLHARSLELDREGGRVRALHGVSTREGDEHVVIADDFVLAAGGVESARLLLLSRGPAHPDGIGNAGGRVGQGFRDHAFSVTQLVLDADVGWGVPSHASATDHHRGGEARRERGAFHLVFLRDPLTDDLVRRASAGGALSIESLRAMARSSFLVLGTAELGGEGHVELDLDARDRYGDPLPRVRFRPNDRDEATLLAMRGAIDAFADSVHAIDPDTGGAPGWGSHPMGACAMGRSPDDGVVDRDAQVFGVENLFVAGSAIFPSFGSASPTLTLTALALRLAAHLEKRGRR